MNKQLLNVNEVADYLSIPVSRVYVLAGEGILPAVRVGRALRFAPEALEEFVAGGGKGFSGVWRKAQ